MAGSATREHSNRMMCRPLLVCLVYTDQLTARTERTGESNKREINVKMFCEASGERGEREEEEEEERGEEEEEEERGEEEERERRGRERRG